MTMSNTKKKSNREIIDEQLGHLKRQIVEVEELLEKRSDDYALHVSILFDYMRTNCIQADIAAYDIYFKKEE